MADERAAAADAAASVLRCRQRGREEDGSKVCLLSAPPEVMSVIMLFLDGATLSQASCVSKVGATARMQPRVRVCTCVRVYSSRTFRVSGAAGVACDWIE